MKSNAVIIICSRPESKRLTNKVFRSLAGKPAIDHLLNRLKGIGIPTVLAIPTGCRAYDHLLLEYKDLPLYLFEGNPESPLHRMAEVVSSPEFSANKWIIRITHDDILIDQRTIKELLAECEKIFECGYGITPEIVDGSGVEVIRKENLMWAAEKHKEPTEFISYFVKDHPYPTHAIYKPRSSICRKYRLTMDYEEDAVLLDFLLKKCGQEASLDEIVSYLDQRPSLLNINRLPLLSIYTCTYNAERYLGQTIFSLLHGMNGFSDFEYILVDDGSTDDTLLKASAFCSDSRFRLFAHSSNRGLASSSNFAISQAKGTYVMRLDADDWLIPGAIPKMIRSIEETGYGVIYSGYFETNELGSVKGQVGPQVNHHAGCALMDKRLLNEVRFTEGIRHLDSMDLYQRLSMRCQVGYIDEPLWYYRRHENNLSRNKIERGKAKMRLGLSASYTNTSYAI